jgi:leucyl/phenylalanyl-tRNA--protein transferase
MAFPSFLIPDLPEELGLVGIGGDLSPERLLQAYRQGIFPWFDEQGPIMWWSPDPRAIFELDGLHVSRRLARTIRSGRFSTTVNQAFDRVIRACADRPGDGIWITPDMIVAYERLHRLGYAHSVEVWAGSELAGGLYGVAIGGFFAGESMFHRRRDASKVALVLTVQRLQERRFQLFDIQFLTGHTTRLGAMVLSRHKYLARLKKALAVETTFV